MKTDTVRSSEMAILSRVLDSEETALSEEAARFLLMLTFQQPDRDRMTELAEKARAGTLTGVEQDEINSYEKVGHIISLLKSKARLALRNRVSGA